MSEQGATPGALVSLEGGEATGKSTLRRAVYRRLEERGLGELVPEEPELLHEPGGTPLAEELRTLLLDSDHDIDPIEATLLFNAARANLVREVVQPLLERGKLVVLDRFIDSTTVYQTVDGGLDEAALERINRFGSHGMTPELTLLIDLSPEVALARREREGEGDRYERKPLEFHRRVRKAYLELAAQHPERFVVLDGQLEAGELARQAVSAILRELDLAGTDRPSGE